MRFNFDQYGLIVQQDGDGGDSPARSALYWFLQKLLDKGYYEFGWLWKIQIEPGVFIRNPIKWNDPKDFSRDQENPIIIFLGYFTHTWGTRKMLPMMFLNRIKRFGLYQNHDISGPQDWGLFIRAMRLLPLYPFLLFSDLFVLLNSMIICFWNARTPGPILNYLGKYWWGFVDGNPPNQYGVRQNPNGPNNVGNDINHCMMLLQAMHIYATPISWLARIIYVKFRPGGVQKAWDIYFDPKTGANPFNELARPIIKEYLT